MTSLWLGTGCDAVADFSQQLPSAFRIALRLDYTLRVDTFGRFSDPQRALFVHGSGLVVQGIGWGIVPLGVALLVRCSPCSAGRHSLASGALRVCLAVLESELLKSKRLANPTLFMTLARLK